MIGVYAKKNLHKLHIISDIICMSEGLPLLMKSPSPSLWNNDEVSKCVCENSVCTLHFHVQAVWTGNSAWSAHKNNFEVDQEKEI